MWRFQLSRQSYVRPQLLTSLVAVAITMCGVYITSSAPISSSVVADTRPHVAGVAVVRPPAPPPVDCGVQACLALTFDDGPNAEVTPLVLDVLARHRARATFFVVGSHVKGNEALLRRMYQEGHEIGNHSWNHPRLSTLRPDEVRAQLDMTQSAVVGAGVPAPTLLRPPYGDVNSVVESATPMTIALWNVDPEDWNRKRPEDILPLVKDHVGPGRVVVLHDTHRPTAECLDGMLADLQKDYKLVTFSELFNLTPGQPGRYYGR